MAEPSRLGGEGLVVTTVLVAAACGLVIGLVSSRLGVIEHDLFVTLGSFTAVAEALFT